MQRQIIVTISPEGEAGIKVQGHAGPGCKNLTSQLESLLGETTASRRTAEFHQAERRERRQRAG